ncbi:hypothetical protein D8674_026250 [Pyrus ussuriensis x Pyrus communis]|uniref:Uncharacterized protein n=1 Tax=Pyrus ussuriensis x Pyrus communis TaxID=2448454 RepID=A0A5N5I6E5_9ROSA|nr:hypothetical protein D8674_026250 [Pyrus ussuriensis x Pyrus communis]
MYQVTKKIKATRLQLANWAKTTKRSILGEISKTEDKLNALLGSPLLKPLFLGIKIHIFFHQKANRRQRRNSLLRLFDEAGVWHADKRGMEMVIVDYFTKLFNSQGATDVSEIMWVVTPKISNEEIKGALFQMHPTKAPGPGGKQNGGRAIGAYAEAAAARAATLFLRRWVMKQVQVEGDALLVIFAIKNAGATFNGHYGYMFDDTSWLLQDFKQWKITFGQVAHHLTRCNLTVDHSVSWFEELPDVISHLLLEDRTSS